MEALALAERTCEEKLHSLTQAKVGAAAHLECFGQAKAGAAVPVYFGKYHETQAMDGLAVASVSPASNSGSPSLMSSSFLSPSFLPFIFPYDGEKKFVPLMPFPCQEECRL